MRQIVTTGTGDIDVLKVQEKPDPAPGPDEVVRRVRAAGLNFADSLARQGLYPDSPPKPCVMAYEVSGVVEAAGKDVNNSFVGKSVVAMTRFGGQSEMVAVKATCSASVRFSRGNTSTLRSSSASRTVATVRSSNRCSLLTWTVPPMCCLIGSMRPVLTDCPQS